MGLDEEHEERRRGEGIVGRRRYRTFVCMIDENESGSYGARSCST
jgi:hypothetical protein